MSRIVVSDAGLLAQFRVVGNRTEICDPSGKVLGTYSPQSVEPPYGVKSPYSAAELDEFECEPGRPLAEVWKSLGRS